MYTGGYPVTGTSEDFQFIGSGVIGGVLPLICNKGMTILAVVGFDSYSRFRE